MTVKSTIPPVIPVYKIARNEVDLKIARIGISFNSTFSDSCFSDLRTVNSSGESFQYDSK